VTENGSGPSRNESITAPTRPAAPGRLGLPADARLGRIIAGAGRTCAASARTWAGPPQDRQPQRSPGVAGYVHARRPALRWCHRQSPQGPAIRPAVQALVNGRPANPDHDDIQRSELIGYCAAALTTLSFLLQAWHTPARATCVALLGMYGAPSPGRGAVARVRAAGRAWPMCWPPSLSWRQRSCG
jgi:hypothetical protein